MISQLACFMGTVTVEKIWKSFGGYGRQLLRRRIGYGCGGLSMGWFAHHDRLATKNKQNAWVFEEEATDSEVMRRWIEAPAREWRSMQFTRVVALENIFCS
ncbi:hypothetical protein M9H77_09163 [Catharanthus roseus]|uniref:Uncharacterized protein n=1 Tax=Catharanthus roseus TaxID=4058 RepID=A0ACC0C080_CATRO|nr:hypothetical protein M9H77_09163 [Catharanthus roseus]